MARMRQNLTAKMSHDGAEELNNWLHSTQLMFECETSAYHHACHDITG